MSDIPAESEVFLDESGAPAKKRDNTSKVSALQKRRAELSLSSSNLQHRAWKCCKSLQCFRNVNSGFFKAQRSRVLKMLPSERKSVLSTMLRRQAIQGKSKLQFYFDGSPVCATFLRRGFGFSNDIQCAVKETPMAKGSRALVRLPKLGAAMESRDFIRIYLSNLAASTANQMPDSNEAHLPYFQKAQVYRLFISDWDERDEYGNLLLPPTFSYFTRIWKESCSHLKCTKVHRFSKCDVCEKLRFELGEAGMDRRRTDQLRDLKDKHNNFVRTERLEYYQNRDKARTFPDKYCSIIIDGADQSAFGLPHWPFSTKATQKGHKIKVHLIGVLEHKCVNDLALFTMTDEFSTGANHIIEATHRWLVRRSMEGSLPSTLFVQVDNCSRENKNRFFFAYMECLVSLGVFVDVYVSFLPVGHTHEDIDQAFSCTSRRLRNCSAVTLADLHSELCQSYTPNPHVTEMKSIANISELFLSEGCLEKVPPFSTFRYFHFRRAGGDVRSANERFRTVALVKVNSTASWSSLFRGHARGFLLFTPNIAATPPTLTVPPNDFAEVGRQLAVAEGRIANTSKVAELELLKEHVYTARSDPFHWNWDAAPEANGRHYNTADDWNSDAEGNDSVDGMESEKDERVQDYIYEIGDLLAVRTDNRSCPFWLGIVGRSRKNSNGEVLSLHVDWLEAYLYTEDPFQSKYRPAILPSGIRWKDEISVNTVLARLTKLRSDRTLSVDDSKRVRESLTVLGM